DLFLGVHLSHIQDLNFADIWQQTQNKVIKDYWQVENKTFHVSVIERALREYIATGKIPRQPLLQFNKYAPLLYGLKSSRCLESQSIFGTSPLPITPDFTNWKILNHQNIISALDRFMQYSHLHNQHQYVIREILRRIIKSFENIKVSNENSEEISETKTQTLLIKLVYTLINEKSSKQIRQKNITNVQKLGKPKNRKGI
ncbi:MAG: hypothetical protein EZS28_034745, partial [Streblomastix strix]